MSVVINYNHITKRNVPFNSNLNVKIISDEFLKTARVLKFFFSGAQ